MYIFIFFFVCVLSCQLPLNTSAGFACAKSADVKVPVCFLCGVYDLRET